MTTERPDTDAADGSDDTRTLSGRKQLVLWAILFVILFAAAEGMMRIGTALLDFNLDASYGYPADLFVEDPELGFGLKPGFVGRFPNAPYDDIEIRINSLGYRDREFPPPTDRTRILVVGDSITFGAGVRAEDRFTERLEASLCDGDCEVLNLGVNNYQAENYLAQIRTHGEELAPDWVILGFCLNDIQSKADLGDLDKVLRQGVGNRLRGLLSHSQLIRVATRIWRALTLDAEAYDQRWIRLAMAAWSQPANQERLATTLHEIRTLTRGQGARLAAVLFPERHQLDEYSEYGLPYTRAEQALRALGVPLVSLLPALEDAIATGELSRDEIYLPGDNIHFTPRVHGWIAETMKHELGPQLVGAARTGSP